MEKATTPAGIAMVFPGQGSQSIGMLAALAAHFPVVEETFAEASAVLEYNLWRCVQEGAETDLNRTDVTQPAMLAAGVAVWRVWQLRGGAAPAVMAGHSLGEYTALVCAGAIGFSDAVRLVQDRGRFMQEAVPAGAGAMAALLGLDNDAVARVCQDAARGDIVAPVNLNAPGQVVIAGTAGAVGRAIELARTAGAKRAVTLPVSVPSHCALMKPAAEKLARLLGTIVVHTPTIGVVNNVDVAINAAPDGIRNALVRQLYNPVRWVEVMEHIASHRVRAVIECGPGKVLTGLGKRINRDLAVLPVYDPETLDLALDTLQPAQG